jgi:ferredoxin
VHVWTDDERGPVDIDALLALAPEAAPLYVCGPAGLIAGLRARVPSPTGHVTELHYESFAPAPIVDGKAFELTLARTGAQIAVAADESALAAVRRHLPHVAYSCQQGFCGSCKVRVLEGAVDHRDQCLTPDQRHGHMMLCVSRKQPGTAEPLVLDL